MLKAGPIDPPTRGTQEESDPALVAVPRARPQSPDRHADSLDPGGI